MSNLESGLTVSQLISRWRDRRREILNTLPAELVAEYDQLGTAIKCATKELSEREAVTTTLSIPMPVPTSLIWIGQVPLWSAALSAWCQSNGLKYYCLSEADATQQIWTLPVTNAGGAPCLLLQNAENNVIGWGKPDSFEAFKELMKTYIHMRPVITTITFRTPMSLHKNHLMQFLQDRQSATRAEILAETRIPEGSLSVLLRDDEFEQVERGRWKLKGKPLP